MSTEVFLGKDGIKAIMGTVASMMTYERTMALMLDIFDGIDVGGEANRLDRMLWAVR